jgi:protein O-mannosyl-transferase
VNRIQRDSISTFLVCLVLALLTLAAFWPVRHCAFVDYDDQDYVTENGAVRRGLTREGISWAFRSTELANWHPLTWLSHMLDCQLYGLNPQGHHGTNLILHVASTLILFLG